MEKNNNSVINALKRLERIGDESSRVTEKLKQACTQVAEKILKSVPFSETDIKNLPRGYSIHVIEVEEQYSGSAPFSSYYEYLIKDDIYWINNSDYWVKPKYNNQMRLNKAFNVEMQTRVGCLEFAADISNGLLNEIADWLEERKTESEKAITVIENAQEEI